MKHFKVYKSTKDGNRLDVALCGWTLGMGQELTDCADCVDCPDCLELLEELRR